MMRFKPHSNHCAISDGNTLQDNKHGRKPNKKNANKSILNEYYYIKIGRFAARPRCAWTHTDTRRTSQPHRKDKKEPYRRLLMMGCYRGINRPPATQGKAVKSVLQGGMRSNRRRVLTQPPRHRASYDRSGRTARERIE
jgi:hypothetical protein